MPLTVHTLDPPTATTLEVEADGAILVRPDAQEAARWASAPADPAAELRVAASAWYGRQPALTG